MSDAQKHFVNIKQEWDSDTRKMIERRLRKSKKDSDSSGSSEEAYD
jgi:hypothetical protein